MRKALYWGLLVVVGLVAALFAFWLKDIVGLSTNVTIVLFGVVVAVLAFFYEISPRRKLTWRRLSSQLGDNVVSIEKLTDFETKLQNQWKAGDHTVDVMVCLSQVYLHLKRPQDAEHFAQQVCAEEEAKGLVKYWDWQRRNLRDNAYLARASARALQGNFAQAAHELEQYRKPHALLWNHVTTYTAFLYLLAEDDTMVRAVTADIKPYTGQKWRVHLSPAYQFLAAYLQQRFLNQDTTSTLTKLGIYLQTWFDAYRAYADFDTYHARMRNVVADMADVVPMGWLQFANLRLSLNEAEKMISEMENKRVQGDTSYQTALALANAHAHLGHGDRAESLARTAFDAIQAEGWFVRDDLNARFLTNSAYETVSAALSMQGRFGEAADFIMQIAPRALFRNYCLMLGAWNHYLADNFMQARTAIEQMNPLRPTMEHRLNPDLMLLHAYLRYRLGMDESPAMLIQQAPYALNVWQESLKRLVDNPYWSAVKTMVDDVQTLLNEASQAPAQTQPEESVNADYFTVLRNALRAASEQAFSQIREHHPDEDFYAFAINTDDSVMTAVACANSEQAYQRKTNEFEYSETERRFARWNVGDWAYEGITTEFSQAVHQMLNGAERDAVEDSMGFGMFRAQVHQTMIESLQDLETNHFWGTGEVREKVTVFVSVSDSDMAEQLENTSAQKLNPVSVYERFLARHAHD